MADAPVPAAKVWMIKAWRDLETARRVATGEPPFLDVAVYHCQQAAEKAVKAFLVHHGNIDALGFRIGGLAYTPDLNSIPPASAASLENLDVWIVDALKRTPHPSHFSLDETLSEISRFQPKRAVLTNMHIDLDFATLDAETPANVTPAHDGMTIAYEV